MLGFFTRSFSPSLSLAHTISLPLCRSHWLSPSIPPSLLLSLPLSNSPLLSLSLPFSLSLSLSLLCCGEWSKKPRMWPSFTLGPRSAMGGWHGARAHRWPAQSQQHLEWDRPSPGVPKRNGAPPPHARGEEVRSILSCWFWIIGASEFVAWWLSPVQWGFKHLVYYAFSSHWAIH